MKNKQIDREAFFDAINEITEDYRMRHLFGKEKDEPATYKIVPDVDWDDLDGEFNQWWELFDVRRRNASNIVSWFKKRLS